MQSLKHNWIIIVIVAGLFLLIFSEAMDAINTPKKIIPPIAQEEWTVPSLYLDRRLEGEERKRVIYGEELIPHTARYLGPNGSVAPITNGMNCQNCHLKGGRKSWGITMEALRPTIQNSVIAVARLKQYTSG